MPDGAQRIAKERQRQIDEEGWGATHDDQHTNGELALAGAAYAVAEDMRENYKSDDLEPSFWPWDKSWWKPTPENRIRELEKAGALIAAEIDRLLRIRYNKEENSNS